MLICNFCAERFCRAKKKYPVRHKTAKTLTHYRFALKMAAAVFAETLDNFQRSPRLISESQVVLRTPAAKILGKKY
jgi:hypothetical protein